MRRTDSFPMLIAGLGALMLLNGMLGVQWLFDGSERFSETAGSWQFAVFQRVQLVALVMLAVLVPGLRDIRSELGRRLSPTVLTALSGAVVLQAGTVFTMAFAAPFYAATAPATLDLEDGGTFALAMSGSWVLFLIVAVALGVSAIRTKTLPVVAGVLIIIGGLITPVLGPIGSAFLGAAFLWAGLSLRQQGTAQEHASAPAL